MVFWQLTIDANDPPRLVRFWAPVLGYEVPPAPAGFDSWPAYYASLGVEITDWEWVDRLRDPRGEGPTIWFQQVPETKTIKNRLHLDVYPTGRNRDLPVAQRRKIVEAKVAELVATGATVLRRFPDDFDTAESPDVYFVVCADPEGNEFCVG